MPSSKQDENLIIVESPAKARTIGRILNNKYNVVATLGHLIDLPKNKLGVDINNNYYPEYVPIKGKTKIIRQLKSAVKKASKVLLATDPDREGEAIAWQVLELTKPKNYQRIVFHEITEEAIKSAIQHARDLDTNLVNAQKARRILDRLIGYPLSQLLWEKLRYGLSAGRVQSAALRLIVEREEERENFKPTAYYIIHSKGKPIFYIYKGSKKAKLTDKTLAQKLTKLLNLHNEFIVSEVKEQITYQNPPPPFDTATLQQEANRTLGYKAKYTMQLAQQLYQGVNIPGAGHKALITYMRTDSYHLSDKAIKQFHKFLTKYYPKIRNESIRKYKTKSKLAQEAHEAIRPINIFITPQDLEGKLPAPLVKLYALIWNRALATQAKPAKYKRYTIVLSPQNTTLQKLLNENKLSIKLIDSLLIEPGFLKLYNMLSEETKDTFKKGNKLDLTWEISQKTTKPPSRYTDASLVKTLKELGIGRPSTYATIISILPKRGYVEYEGRYIKPTELGKVVTNFLKKFFPNIVDYEFTSKIEDDLDHVAAGRKNYINVIDAVYPTFEKSLKTAKEQADKKELTVIGESEETCPICGKPMVIKLGRFGKFLSCIDYPTCKGIKPYIDMSKYIIPKEAQNGEYVLRMGKYGYFWAHKDYPKVKKTLPLLLKETCPKCGAHLVERKTNKGKKFIGCSAYPKCDFIKQSRS